MFAVVIGLGGSAYAMDIGGIQRTVQVWIHGDQTDATLVIENGSYSLDYEDEDGKLVHRGGGVAINPDGTERPLTEEELWDEINAPEVEYEEDGRVVVYYLNQQLDVTDKFVDGACYVQLQVEDSVFLPDHQVSKWLCLEPSWLHPSEPVQLATTARASKRGACCFLISFDDRA